MSDYGWYYRINKVDHIHVIDYDAQIDNNRRIIIYLNIIHNVYKYDIHNKFDLLSSMNESEVQIRKNFWQGLPHSNNSLSKIDHWA